MKKKTQMTDITSLSLEQVYRALSSEADAEDRRRLKKLAADACAAAARFDAVVDEDFVRKYLADDLPIDALCELTLSVSTGGDSYSVSHQRWLHELRLAKMIWDRKAATPQYREGTIAELMLNLRLLQKMAAQYVRDP